MGILTKLEDYQKNLLEQFNNKYPILDKKILEIGSDLNCNTAMAMIEMGAAEVWAVNPLFDKDFVSPHPKIHVIKNFGEKIQLKSGQFDIIFGIALLEHVIEPKALFNKCKRLLKKNGICYLQGWPTWLSPDGHHIWLNNINGRNYHFNDETNPFDDWEYLLLDKFKKFEIQMKNRGIPEEDILPIYNYVYKNQGENSRIPPTKIINIAKSIKQMDVVCVRLYTNIRQNDIFEQLKEVYSVEDLKTNGLELYFKFKNKKSLFSIYDENHHKVVRFLGIKIKFRSKGKK
ncbi:MAG: methyltransferase domain-containing protein [Clostridium sp.]|nr:methyltransferase domain-containing protein [Clostridium sp.]